MAIDAYCLLHRGAYACSRELVEGEPTDRHVHYCMSRVALLTSVGVTPLVVFDGGRLPNKLDEERTRERNREENKARARALWQQGNKSAAMECYQKAVDITPAHAKQFIEVGAGLRGARGARVVGLYVGEGGCQGDHRVPAAEGRTVARGRRGCWAAVATGPRMGLGPKPCSLAGRPPRWPRLARRSSSASASSSSWHPTRRMRRWGCGGVGTPCVLQEASL